jgi:hypothetical protein
MNNKEEYMINLFKILVIIITIVAQKKNTEVKIKHIIKVITNMNLKKRYSKNLINFTLKKVNK